MKDHEHYMRLALDLAREAGEDGEAPIGCIVVDAGGAVIGRGRNRREKNKDATGHAEMEAIAEAGRSLGDWRLDGCRMYVTLEPCPMCAGAILMSRIERIYFGASDDATGACGGVFNLFMESYGHKAQIFGGLLTEECSALLSGFFKRIRETAQPPL